MTLKGYSGCSGTVAKFGPVVDNQRAILTVNKEADLSESK
jgi:hypothetical protein